MIGWFGPAWQRRKALKSGRELWHALRRHRIYASDVLDAGDLSRARALEDQLDQAIRKKDDARVRELSDEIFQWGKRVFPASGWDVWRENVEVFVVAIVIALAIKSYFFQPFKIPTGSMQPTLNGVILTPTTEPFPSWPRQILDFVILGRTYHEIKTRTGGEVRGWRQGSMTPWFEYTDVALGGEVLRIWAPASSLRSLQLFERKFKPGETVARFRMDTGDQLLVNKMAYHFRRPKMGEVFVFSTAGIAGIENPRRRENPNLEGSQFYIKRCAGLPGEAVSLDPPYLLVDGKPVHAPPIFDRIYSMKDGYQGYVVMPDQPLMNPPGTPFLLKKDEYLALGDNSANSRDSRYWGAVPRRNLVGTGFMVYWPFTRHWGWIE